MVEKMFYFDLVNAISLPTKYWNCTIKIKNFSDLFFVFTFAIYIHVPRLHLDLNPWRLSYFKKWTFD